VAKKESDVKVKAYRTKDGRLVKPYTRRQKIAIGVSGAAAIGGLVLAAKNRKLLKNVKAKSQKINYDIPSTAKVPDLYEIKPGENAKLSTVDMNFDSQSFNMSMDKESSEYLGSYAANKIMGERNNSLFLSYVNKDGNLEHFINSKIDLLGATDYQNRPLAAIVKLKLPKDVDPRGFDFKSLQEKIQSDPKAVQIFRDNYNKRRVSENYTIPEEDVSYIENLLKVVPSTSDPSRTPKDLRKIRDSNVSR
jgi:hypothetical protein